MNEQVTSDVLGDWWFPERTPSNAVLLDWAKSMTHQHKPILKTKRQTGISCPTCLEVAKYDISGKCIPPIAVTRLDEDFTFGCECVICGTMFVAVFGPGAQSSDTRKWELRVLV